MMKYLVTGATGFLGKHIINHLATQGLDYVAVSRQSSGDLTTFTDWAPLLNGVDVVIHAAGKAHDMSKSAGLKNTYTQVNLDLTRRLAEACKKSGVKKFIFISTIKVNGELTESTPFKADDVPNPGDAYGASKYLAEQELHKLHEAGLFEITIIRSCLIYGTGVKANFESLINLVKKQWALPFGAVHNKRSFISAGNLCDLILCCANSPAAAGQIFLASDDNDLSLTELIVLIAKALHIKPHLVPVPVPLMTLLFKIIGKADFSVRLFSNLQVDIAKTKKLLNWQPPQTTAKALEEMLARQ